MNPSINTFEIAAIFKELYGYVPPSVQSMPQAISTNEILNIPQNSNKRVTKNGSNLYGLQDSIGREVFCPLTIVAGKNQPVPEVYEFPYAVISLKNDMVYKKTPMIERGGVVIEEMGAGPWEIKVKGFFIDTANVFPDEQLNLLGKLYRLSKPVSVRSPLTDQFLLKDDKALMVDLEIPFKPKVMGVRDFSFTLIEDAILDLYLLDSKTSKPAGTAN